MSIGVGKPFIIPWVAKNVLEEENMYHEREAIYNSVPLVELLLSGQIPQQSHSSFHAPNVECPLST